MTRLLLALVALSSLASAIFLGLLLRQGRADRATLYREARQADRTSAIYNRSAEYWQGRYSQCVAYSF